MSGVSHTIEGIVLKVKAVPETEVVKLCPDERMDE